MFSWHKTEALRQLEGWCNQSPFAFLSLLLACRASFLAFLAFLAAIRPAFCSSNRFGSFSLNAGGLSFLFYCKFLFLLLSIDFESPWALTG